MAKHGNRHMQRCSSHSARSHSPLEEAPNRAHVSQPYATCMEVCRCPICIREAAHATCARACAAQQFDTQRKPSQSLKSMTRGSGSTAILTILSRAYRALALTLACGVFAGWVTVGFPSTPR